MPQWYIFFGEDWGRHSSTGQFLAAEIAKTRNVLWVNSLGARVPGLNLSDIKRVIQKLCQFTADTFFKKHGADRETTSLHVITPIAIPVLKYKIVRILNGFIVGRFIRKKMQQLGVTLPIVISAGPESVYVIDKLGATKKVYYCADKYTEFPGQDKQLVADLESEILQMVDAVIVTSVALYEDLQKLHKNVKYIPHGVDYALFSSGINSSQSTLVNELAMYKRPIIGFIGLIGPHLNYKIIEKISTEFAQASILMIGPVEEGASPPRNDNIYYLGKKGRNELPAFIHSFDICITPYIDSERIRYANPTKVREYVAAGCPTICTPQHEARLISDEIYFAVTGHDFVSKIREILDSDIDRIKISKSVATQTWADRAMQVIEYVESST